MRLGTASKLADASFIRTHLHVGNNIYRVKCYSCNETYEVPDNPRTPPSDIVIKNARRAGWDVGYGCKPKCPAHRIKSTQQKVERDKAIDEFVETALDLLLTPPPPKPEPKPEPEPLRTTTPMTKPPIITMPSKPNRLADPAPAAPTVQLVQPNMRLVKQVMDLLDEHFDLKALRYKPSWSDEKIAQEVGIHLTQVGKIRSEAYGDIAEDPAITKLRDDFDLMRMELDELTKRVNAAAQELDGFSNRRKFGV